MMQMWLNAAVASSPGPTRQALVNALPEAIKELQRIATTAPTVQEVALDYLRPLLA